MFKRFFAALLCALLLPACGADEDARLYGELMRQIQAEKEAKTGESETNDGTVTRKLTITLPGNQSTYDWDFLSFNAREYMKLHPDVRISFMKMGEDVIDFAKNLSVSLMAGSSADIVDLGYLPNANKLLESGHFTDLYEFMDNDPEFNPDDYYMNVVKSVERGGKLPALCMQFFPISMEVRSDISDELTARFLSDEVKTLTDALNLYLEAADDRMFYMNFAPTDMLLDIFQKAVDFDRKTVSLNTAENRVLFEKLKAIELPFHIKYGDDGVKTIAGVLSPNDMFYHLMGRGDFNYAFRRIAELHAPDFMAYAGRAYSEPKQLMDQNGEYPFSVHELIAVPKSSANKELAWDFIKFCISDRPKAPDNYSPNVSMIYYALLVGWSPINKANYARRVEDQNNADFLAGEEESYGLDERLEDGADKGAEFAKARAAMLAAAERVSAANLEYQDIVGYFGLGGNFSYDYSIRYIDDTGLVWPDLYLYLSGRQGVEATLENIQSKVRVFLNE